jgi:hypothetical protein
MPDQFLGDVEPTLEQRHEGVHRRGEPDLCGLTDLLRQTRNDRELQSSVGAISSLPSAHAPIPVAVHRSLWVAEALRGSDESLGDLQTRVHVLCGEEDGPAATVEGVRERRFIAEALGHLDRLDAEPPSAFDVGIVPERSAGEASQQVHAQGIVVGADGLDRLFEEANEIGIVS